MAASDSLATFGESACWRFAHAYFGRFEAPRTTEDRSSLVALCSPLLSSAYPGDLATTRQNERID